VKETPGSGNQNLILRLPAVPDLTFSEKAVRPALCRAAEKERRRPLDDLLMTAVAPERWPEQISGLTSRTQLS
jgi:hypothetical protein